MLGSSLQLGRRHGEDRFYTAAMALRGHHQNSLRTRSSAAASAAFLNPALLPAFKDKPVVGDRRQLEDRSSSSSARAADACNLDRFLESTTPSVLAHYLPKVSDFSSFIQFLVFFLIFVGKFSLPCTINRRRWGIGGPATWSIGLTLSSEICGIHSRSGVLTVLAFLWSWIAEIVLFSIMCLPCPVFSCTVKQLSKE